MNRCRQVYNRRRQRYPFETRHDSDFVLDEQPSKPVTLHCFFTGIGLSGPTSRNEPHATDTAADEFFRDRAYQKTDQARLGVKRLPKDKMNGSLGKLIVSVVSRSPASTGLSAGDCREADDGIIAQGRDGFQRHVTGALTAHFVLFEKDRADEVIE
jgi:hypothetical protein